MARHAAYLPDDPYLHITYVPPRTLCDNALLDLPSRGAKMICPQFACASKRGAAHRYLTTAETHHRRLTAFALTVYTPQPSRSRVCRGGAHDAAMDRHTGELAPPQPPPW